MGKSRKKKGNVQRLTAPIQNPDYIICTDGGCAYNPGGPGGIGVVITRMSDMSRTELSAGYTSTTNNRMEIRAVMAALEAVPDARAIRLYSDSQYTLNCMAGLWEKKKNLDLWKQLEKLCAGKEIELRWIRGHNNHPDNERCDELATQGIHSADKIPDVGYSPEADIRHTDTEPLSIEKIGRKVQVFGKKENNGHTSREASGHTGSGESTSSSMHVEIDIPAALKDSNPGMMSPSEYAARYHVKPQCAQAICTFYIKGSRNFKAYNAIKTGGVDEHSYKTLEGIAEKSPDPDLFISTLKKYLTNPKDVASAARWYDRGLTLKDSIRKALVDAEVRANCLKTI